MRQIFATLFVFVCFAASGLAAEANQNEKPLTEIKQEIADGKAVMVDVREQGEWNAGHVKAATLVPLSALKAGKSDLSALPKDKTIYTYCVVGARSLTAAGILNGHGYHAMSLKQGFDELSKNGFEPSK